MAVTGIGIRSIWSRSGAAWQGKKPAPQRADGDDDRRDDDGFADADRGAEPAPGTGVLVDLKA